MRNILLVALSIASFAPVAFAGDAAKGKTTYDTICAACHGASGLGDGPIGAAMPADQKPRNLQDTASYKYAKDDSKIAEIIRKGGAAVGLSMMMPAQAALSDDDIANVVAYVKTLQK